jgi:hypothetical protein
MSWLHKVLGKDGTTQLAVDPTHLAARVSGRPMELGARGAYSAAFETGVIAAGIAANSELFQFRFVHASYFALLRTVKCSAAVSTTAFAAGVPVALEARNARAWSTQGTGGTGITFGADDGKKRKDFASTVVGSGDVRIATTTGLGAGTKTLDGTAVRMLCGQPGTAVANIVPPASIVWLRDTSDEYPFLYENNEGLVIRVVEAPGTGTWKLCVEVEWAEIDPAGVSGW